MHFFPKKHPKFLKRLIFIWEKAIFFFEQLFPDVARTWLGERSGFFLGRNLGFWPKNRIFAILPQFWSTARLQPLERSFIYHLGNDFSTFRSGVTAVFYDKVYANTATYESQCYKNSEGLQDARSGCPDILHEPPD